MALLTGQPSPEAMRNVRAGARRARMGLGQVFGGDPNRFLTNQERAQDQLQGLLRSNQDFSVSFVCAALILGINSKANADLLPSGAACTAKLYKFLSDPKLSKS